MDWNTLRTSAGETPRYEIAELKDDLPIAYVLSEYGHTVEDRNGTLKTRCPFHADQSPSFDIFEKEGKARFGCYPCGIQGDVIDLIMRLDNSKMGDAITRASELLTQFREDGSEAPAPKARERIDPGTVADAVFIASTNSLDELRELIKFKKWPVEAEYLREVFEVGCIGNEIIIPYRDLVGDWSGYKIRRGADKWAATGSVFNSWYAGWLDKGRPDVVVVEGEPDTWAAYLTVGARYDVLGLPTGAGTIPKPELLEMLRNRNVTLAFDGDTAGREGARTWAEKAESVGARIRVVTMPDGYDLSMLDDIGRAVEEARYPVPFTGGLEIEKGFYVKPSGKESTPICNWTFEAERELRGEDGGVAYEGILSVGNNSRDLITHEDLASAQKLYQWSARRGLSWRGTDKDAHDLLALFESQGAYLSPGKMTGVLGLHEGHFVTPTETIGRHRWVFTSKPGIITKHLDFQARPGWQNALMSLFALHEPQVMSPLLAWLAAAPVRSLIDEFPILAVTGGSGAGKTTLLKTVLAGFSGGALGGKDGISLADTTKHAITEHAGATNAVPVWFDEYRASIKPDTRDALHNTLLASYIGQTTSKGAVTDRGLGVTNWAHHAPIIVSGESTFAETAHVERMVLLALPRAGRNPAGLAKTKELLPSGVAEAYLHWLVYQAHLPRTLAVVPFGHSDLPNRVRTNLGVLKLGWDLLSEFMFEANLASLPALDLSLVISEAQESADEEPIIEMVRWAVESANSHLGEPLVIFHEGSVFIRVESLVAEANRYNRFHLPGNAKAVRRVLVERYEGEEVTKTFGDRFPRPTRFIRLSPGTLEL